MSVPLIFIFFGLRIYARQLGVKSRVFSLWFVLAIAAAYVIANSFVLGAIAGNIGKLDISFMSIGGMMLEFASALGAILAWKIRKIVTAAYRRPMTWLFGYLLFNTVAAFFSGLTLGLGTVEGEGMPFYALMAIVGVPVQLLLMWTSYVFKRELSK